MKILFNRAALIGTDKSGQKNESEMWKNKPNIRNFIVSEIIN